MFNSVKVIQSSIARLTTETRISCMYVGSKGVIGYHQAVTPQLFLIVEGKGWVRGGSSDERMPIGMGQAAFWEKGEWHESGTDTGMTAIVMEGETLIPSEFKLQKA